MEPKDGSHLERRDLKSGRSIVTDGSKGMELEHAEKEDGRVVIMLFAEGSTQ